jgi:exodeoxyribonuclease V beta subunit
VDAANAMFLQAERRAGEGAFLFRREGEDPLPFVAVDAKGRDERWSVQGEAAPALTCWWVDEELGATDYRRRMASACAAEIVRLLNLGQQGQAGFVEGERLQPLRPRDIAVLVNDGTEAREVRAALADAGVRSVYLSDRDNVFRSEAAGELQRLLVACAAPEDGALVRAALGTALLAQDWHALDRLNQDEIHWDERIEQFRGYRQCWQRQGVLPMLRRLLHDFEVPQRLVAARDGERLLTDLLHLAELLQQASVLLDGEHALLRFLAEQRSEASAAVDNRQLRLESDADLLKVVTVHKSKGLEYPLVFLPFASACRPVKPDDLPIKWHDEEGRLQLSLRADEEILARADRERLGEDLRKLYVALTRARFATWVGVAPTGDFARSAMGYLLAGGEAVGAGQLEARLRDQLGAHGAIAIVAAPQATGETHAAERTAPVLAPAPRMPRSTPERWWIASYSRLRKAAASGAPRAPETAEEETYLEALDEAPRAPAAAAAPSLLGSLHEFPRGPTPGSFLHGLLEWAGRKGFAAAAEPGEMDDVLARRCRPSRWAPHRDALRDWLTRWLATPLDLRRLAPKSRPVAPRALTTIQPEMEFWLAASRVEAQALDEVVCRHTLAGVPRPRLEPQHLNGMLKGFIDLVFEHEGRYYVADYKSNWLGPDDASYSIDAMRDEVLHARYELQYCLYLFALHRLLRSRLPDYEYERHIGGAVYVFLRGHASPTQGLHFERPPAALMDALDALFTAEVAA